MTTLRGPIARAVGSAIRAAKPEKLDAGTVQLARNYAVLMDNAAPLAKYTKHLDALRSALDVLDEFDTQAGEDAREAFDKIAEALSAHSVASDLGPKLLAALTALGLTPTARRAAMGGQNGAPGSSPADQLRERRATRAARAGAARAGAG